MQPLQSIPTAAAPRVLPRAGNAGVGPTQIPLASSAAPKVAMAKAAAPRGDTGGGGQLAVNDLSIKPQPSWGKDPFSTQLHLERHRLFAKADTQSPAAAVRMYKVVAGS